MPHGIHSGSRTTASDHFRSRGARRSSLDIHLLRLLILTVLTAAFVGAETGHLPENAVSLAVLPLSPAYVCLWVRTVQRERMASWLLTTDHHPSWKEVRYAARHPLGFPKDD